jgi:quinol monooxygenase YgiN
MEAIRVVVRVKNISDISRYKELSTEAIAKTEGEPGVLQYEWYLDEENGECVILETYKDSDAVQAHLMNVGEILPQLIELGEMQVEVLGDIDEQLKALAEQFGAKNIPYFNGIRL